MINLTKHPEAARVLQNACKPNANPRGTWIQYAEGDYSSAVHNTVVGRAAWTLHEAGLLLLCQKRLQDEPRIYAYVGVVL